MTTTVNTINTIYKFAKVIQRPEVKLARCLFFIFMNNPGMLNS